MKSPPRRISSHERAAALIIVLAFVVLVTGLVVAYFSRATSDRPVAHSSFNQSKVDQLAQSAMDNVIGDLRQEITNGSANPAPTFGPASSPLNLYVPTTSSNMLPVRSPIQAAIPNLIRRSVSPDTIPAPARASRASAVNSTADVSANGRSVTLARWNSHYLIPKSDPTNDKTDPITTGFSGPNFWAPDWVFVTNNGATVIAQSDNSVIGRYAYAIYDEGGLVDLNAAGYPSPTTILQYGRKGSLAFADLTGLGSFGLSTTGIDNIVGWRNYASSQPSGSLSSNFSFTPTTATTYYNFILSDPNYIKLTSYSPIFFLKASPGPTPLPNNQTDQAFTGRKELINFRAATSGGIFTSNGLQYLGTLSREGMASTPQWVGPSPPTSTNPNFQTLLVTAPFTRNDGATANVGEYLVNSRFLLQRLNWLTYRGPSATVANGGTRNAVPTSAPAIGNVDYDLWLLTRSNGITFGLTSAFLQQGTAANVLKYFGLAWDTTNERWNYVGHAGGTTPIGTIATLGTLTGTREPDFFELLQAGILDSSLGDAFSSNPTSLPLTHQQSKMLHVLTIGANLIAQSRADSYPVRIACSVGGTTMEAVGAPRLPYLSSLAACPIGVTDLNGGIYWFLVPNLWDPFRDTWDLTEANTANTGNGPLLTPGYLRPPVRITVRGSVGFAGGTVTQSGSVNPASVGSPFASLTGINASLTLATANTSFGRDGLREAMRLGSSDIGGTVTSLITTTSPTSTAAQWNNIARPTNDTSTYRADNFIVFTLSLLGSAITTSGQNPVLILQPGFQVSMDYQSPNGQWYSYSFLQGNNETSTWISSNLDLGTNFSQYGTNAGATFPTLLSSGTATLWTVAALAQAPMFAKADPRSIRYNSQIGVVNLANPPMPFTSAGVIGSIWPSPYATPPSMSPAPFPVPTPTPNANPVTLGDNALAGNGANPYSEVSGDGWRPVMINRPFRSVGEMGYAFRDQPFKTLSFSSTNSPDAGLLDLFTTNAAGPTPTPSPTPSSTPMATPTPTPTPRGGVISLNSRQAPAIAAVLTSAIRREDTPRVVNAGAPSPSPSPLTSPVANSVATSLVSSTSSAPLVNRASLANLIASETGLGPTVPKTQRESIARALGETIQTRTWNLLIDVMAQTGRYPPNAASFKNGFVVEGEQRYWIHVAIDRFTGEVIDKQIEVVNE
jgi:hypothetical protein